MNEDTQIMAGFGIGTIAIAIGDHLQSNIVTAILVVAALAAPFAWGQLQMRGRAKK